MPSYLTFNMHVEGVFEFSEPFGANPMAPKAGMEINTNNNSHFNPPTAEIGLDGRVGGGAAYIDGFTSFSLVRDSSVSNPLYRFEGDISYKLGLRKSLYGGFAHKFEISMETWTQAGASSTWAKADFDHTLELTSITVPDGRTIEEAGLTVEFHPVSTVPEPSSVAIWSLLGCVGLAIGYRRRKQAAA